LHGPIITILRHWLKILSVAIEWSLQNINYVLYCCFLVRPYRFGAGGLARSSRPADSAAGDRRQGAIEERSPRRRKDALEEG